MSESNNDNQVMQSGGTSLKVPILFGCVIALLVAIVYLFLQIDQMHSEMASLRESLLDEVSNLRETSTVTSQTQQRRLEDIREELEVARRQAETAAGQAKTEATARAEELVKKLESEQRRVQQQQQKTQQELNQVAETTNANSTTIGEVRSSVAATKSELKSEIDKTIAALRQVTGDLGVQSGLIATNASELQALKALGDRNYYEFDIQKSRQPIKVGDIAVRLRNTEQKRNRFAIDVVADDKTIEKKYRTVNEPLQFYVSGIRQPYELVINEVHRNRIVGYLATPKVKRERGTPEPKENT